MPIINKKDSITNDNDFKNFTADTVGNIHVEDPRIIAKNINVYYLQNNN